MSHIIICFAGVFFFNLVGKALLIYGYINTHSGCEPNHQNDVIYLHSLQEKFFPALAKTLPRELVIGGRAVCQGEQRREGKMTNSRGKVHLNKQTYFS